MRPLQRVPTTIVPITGTWAPILIAILKSDLALTNVLATTALVGQPVSGRVLLQSRSCASALITPKDIREPTMSGVENEGVEPDIRGRGLGRSLAMKGLFLLGLVGAAIYGALVLSGELLPVDPVKDAFARQSLGDPGDRQLRSWGTDLPALASSSSERASVNLQSLL